MNHEELLDKPKQELVKIIHQLENDAENSSLNVDMLLDEFGFTLNPLQMTIDWNDGYGNILTFDQNKKITFDVGNEFFHKNDDIEKLREENKRLLESHKEYVQNTEKKISCLKLENEQLLSQVMESDRQIDDLTSKLYREISQAADQESTLKDNAQMKEPISLAIEIMSGLEKSYKMNSIYTLDNGMELYDNDIRRIAKHLLVEIGDM